MNKSFIAGLFIVLLFLGNGCNKDNSETRTEEMEAQEIGLAVSKMIAEGLNVDTTNLGSYYVVQKKGSGALPQLGDSVFVFYEAYLLDKTRFDASYDHYVDSLLKFRYKLQSFIPGFEEALSMMNKGTELDIIIPSYLAYGASGPGIVGAYRPLLFSIKMVDIRP